MVTRPRKWVLAAGTLLTALAASPVGAQTPSEQLPPPRVAEQERPYTITPGRPAPLAPGDPAPPPSAECRDVDPRPSREPWIRAWQDCFLGHAGQFVARPLGEAVEQNIRVQVTNAEAARMVLHHYDFVGCGCALNLRGHDELARIAILLAKYPCPLVIERTPENPGLAEARRLVVLQELARGPAPVAPERVVIGPSPTHGLSGLEAAVIYDNLIRQTLTQGVPAGLGGGAIGGTVGQGFGAPGRTAGGVPSGTTPGP